MLVASFQSKQRHHLLNHDNGFEEEFDAGPVTLRCCGCCGCFGCSGCTSGVAASAAAAAVLSRPVRRCSAPHPVVATLLLLRCSTTLRLFTPSVHSSSRISLAALVAARHALRRSFADCKFGPSSTRIHRDLLHQTMRLLGTSLVSISDFSTSSLSLTVARSRMLSRFLAHAPRLSTSRVANRRLALHVRLCFDLFSLLHRHSSSMSVSVSASSVFFTVTLSDSTSSACSVSCCCSHSSHSSHFLLLLWLLTFLTLLLLHLLLRVQHGLGV